MFTELMPLIQNRPLTITLVAEGQKLRVNVIPQPTDRDKEANQKIRGSHEKEVAQIPEAAIAGLTTPLCLTGTPEELDAGIGTTLKQFTARHVSLQESFDAAAKAIAGAVQAIDERERIKKDKDKDKNKNKNKDANSSTKQAAREEAEEEPGLPSLFTAPAAVSADDPVPTGPQIANNAAAAEGAKND